MSKNQAANTARKCGQQLHGILNLNHIRFARDPVAKKRYLLVSSDSSDASVEVEEASSRRVIHLGTHSSTRLWLGITIIFTPDRYENVSQVSIVMFEGNVSDSEKVPLLRAEWDDNDLEHAQPHWHVYTRKRTKKAFNIEPPTSNFGEQSKYETGEIDRFHFAMFSDWHKEGSEAPPKLKLTNTTLPRWLCNCVKYILHQLEYIYLKSSTSSDF